MATCASVGGLTMSELREAKQALFNKEGSLSKRGKPVRC